MPPLSPDGYCPEIKEQRGASGIDRAPEGAAPGVPLT